MRENLLVVPSDQAGERLWGPWLVPDASGARDALREQTESVLEQVG